MKTDTLPSRVRHTSQLYPERPALHYKKTGAADYSAMTYTQFWININQIGAGLKSLGIGRGDKVGIISDNRKEWILCDLAILGLGAVDVPRGSDSTREEVAYILEHSECKAVFCEDQNQLEKIQKSNINGKQIQFFVILDENWSPQENEKSLGKILKYGDLLEKGQEELKKNPQVFESEVDKGQTDDLCTLIYTSGTTGQPKGVMLTHQSFLFQLDRTDDFLKVDQFIIILSVLPVWHSFERVVEYIVFNKGAALAYSKPVGKIMMDDMAQIRPHYLPSVPRIWESVRAAVYRNAKEQGGLKNAIFKFFVGVGNLYSAMRDLFKGRLPKYQSESSMMDKIISFLPMVLLFPLKLLGHVLVFGKLKNKLGGRFVAGISGGGALPHYVDQFFRAAGITVLEGYGLTETAPILACRLLQSPVSGTVGPLLRDIQGRVVGENGEDLAPGEKGVLWVKTPQVMQGYYKRPEDTEKVLQDGWLNTGDLVKLTITGEVSIVGRAKDTIVLMSGENIEPDPIEAKLLSSEYIDQIMVVGQDQKYLGALIVPNFDALEKLALEKKLSYLDRQDLLDLAWVVEFYHEIVQELVNTKSGFKAFERVYKVKLLAKPFEVGVEMTNSLKLKRNVIADLYHKEIQHIFQI